MKKYELELVVEGIIACPGYVKGYAKIVNSIPSEKISKEVSPKPYILISKYTTPDLVPLMYSAVGIVTDIGGITTHAANVAREFGIPCIVGTKNATKLIKDLEEIILDANGNLQDTGKIYRVRKNEHTP